MKCIFCQNIKKEQIIFENDYAFAIYDSFAVSKGHCLIISKRHVETYFHLSPEEIHAFKLLSNQIKELLDKELKPDGYNVGFNCGQAAGQTIMHCHMHIIPRYNGDVDNPRGGIRHVVLDNSGY